MANSNNSIGIDSVKEEKEVFDFQEGGENQGAASKKEKTFTREEFNKALSARLSQQREKHEKALAEKLSEAEKLAKMDAAQKAEYERQQFEKQLSEREAKIAKRELLAEVREQLSHRGLPLELADCLDLSSAESCSKSLAAVESAFAASVEKKINDRFRHSPPIKGAGGKSVKDPFLVGMGF